MGLGMNRQEAGVYLACLEVGESSASRIAKTMGVSRTNVYPVLTRLAEKGFVVIMIRKSRRVYRAQRPNRVASVYSNKLQTFVDLIPSLALFEKKEVNSLGLRFIETQKELQFFYREVLEEYKGKEYQCIGDISGWEATDPEFFAWFRRARARAKTRVRLLLSENSRKINPTEKSLLRECRYLPKEYVFRSNIVIYKDKILITGEDIFSLAVVIAIPAMVDIFRSMFEIIWANTKPEK